MSWLSVLRSASRDNWGRAVKEVLVIAAISLVPLVLKATFFYFKSLQSEKPMSFVDAAIKYIISGDLLFFSVGNLAAVMWIASQDFSDRFEGRVYFILVSMLGFCACSFFIGISPDMIGIPPPVVQAAGLVSFIASIVMNIIMLVFESYSGVDLGNSLARQEAGTTAGLRQRKGK